MRLLFIHQNLPAQFRHVIGTLAAIPGVEIVGLRENKTHPVFPDFGPNVRLVQYPKPKGAEPQTHHYLRPFEQQVRRGQAVVRACFDLRQQGFSPDWVIVHPGWGEGLFIKDVFPNARVVSFLEFYYRSHGSDMDFDPEFPASIDSQFKVRIKNSHLLHDIASADEILAPTRWQADQAPVEFHAKIRVMHDGIRTDIARPNPDAAFRLPDGRTLTRKDRVLTYVARNLEPYRGFHSFMRALPEILAADPLVRVVIVGGDEVSYGRPPEAPFASYREQMLAEVGGKLDSSRVHFVGKQPYDAYVALLQISALHIYLTYPFVLSWSLMEAMSVGCQILASATPPVQEVIEDGKTGHLVDFFDTKAIAARAIALLAGDGSPEIRANARELMVQHYDYQTRIAPQWLEWFGLTKRTG